MDKRRQILRQLACGYMRTLVGAVAIVDCAALRAAPTPMLNESAPEVQLAQYTPAAPGPEKCSNCKNFTPAPEAESGFCKKIPGKRVAAGGVCARFYTLK